MSARRDGKRRQDARAGLPAPEIDDGIDPEVVARVWAQRAAQLASPLVQEEEGEWVQLVLLQFSREVYGVDVCHVVEVRPATHITRVPRVPEWVTGVVNLRGRILSVIDLQRFFGLTPAEPKEEAEQVTPYPDLVVVETPAMEVALLVEDVLAVESFPIAQVQDAAETVGGANAEYVRGAIDRGGDKPAVLVLDLPALLAGGRLVIHEEIV